MGTVRPVFLCLGLALSGMFWSSIYNRRRQRAADRGAEPAAPKDVPVTANLPQSLFTKRQQLLSLFTNHLSNVLESNLQVRHLMSDRLSMVSPRTKADDVRELMAEKKLRHVLVCETDKKLLGVISDRDLKSRSGRTAAEIMTANPLTITPDLLANTAVSAMINNGISCLPVLLRRRVVRHLDHDRRAAGLPMHGPTPGKSGPGNQELRPARAILAWTRSEQVGSVGFSTPRSRDPSKSRCHRGSARTEGRESAGSNRDSWKPSRTCPGLRLGLC